MARWQRLLMRAATPSPYLASALPPSPASPAPGPQPRCRSRQCWSGMSIVAFRDDRRSAQGAVTAGLLLDAARGGGRCCSVLCASSRAGPSLRGFQVSGPTVTPASFRAGQASRAGTPEERELSWLQLMENTTVVKPSWGNTDDDETVF